jgi:hypothetical protein
VAAPPDPASRWVRAWAFAAVAVAAGGVSS